MTLKEIKKIASNPAAMECLWEIEKIQQNMCHKTIYERKTAEYRIKQISKEIIYLLDTNQKERDCISLWG